MTPDGPTCCSRRADTPRRHNCAAGASAGGYDRAVTTPFPLPRRIAGIAVPQDDVSGGHLGLGTARRCRTTCSSHSVRAYCWGAAIAAGEGWSFDAAILWTASLMHDFGLTRIPRNTMCFEVEGAEIARRFLERAGMTADDADRVAIAIILHMQPSVTLDDGVEAVLLDRATGLDVRGDGYELVDAVRAGVMTAFPRRAFDRHFLAAIGREAAIRPACQSATAARTRPASPAGWRARRGGPGRETLPPTDRGSSGWCAVRARGKSAHHRTNGRTARGQEGEDTQEAEAAEEGWRQGEVARARTTPTAGPQGEPAVVLSGRWIRP